MAGDELWPAAGVELAAVAFADDAEPNAPGDDIELDAALDADVRLDADAAPSSDDPQAAAPSITTSVAPAPAVARRHGRAWFVHSSLRAIRSP